MYKGLIFDMDGTLTVPTIDFAAIRREIGIVSGDLTKEIARLSPDEQRKAWAVIEAHEEHAMARQRLQEGAKELLDACRRQNVKLGVVTRNAQRSVDHLCKRFDLRFDAVVTRDFGFLKPDPRPVLHILEQWRLGPRRVLTIGDYLYDVESGRAAGTDTCFFQNPGLSFHGQDADFTVTSMTQLYDVVFRETVARVSPPKEAKRPCPLTSSLS